MKKIILILKKKEETYSIYTVCLWLNLSHTEDKSEAILGYEVFLKGAKNRRILHCKPGPPLNLRKSSKHP